MLVTELNKNQLKELKCSWYDSYLMKTKNENISMYEITNIDDYVSDETIFAEYQDTEFTEDDFGCSTRLV